MNLNPEHEANASSKLPATDASFTIVISTEMLRASWPTKCRFPSLFPSEVKFSGFLLNTPQHFIVNLKLTGPARVGVELVSHSSLHTLDLTSFQKNKHANFFFFIKTIFVVE